MEAYLSAAHRVARAEPLCAGQSALILAMLMNLLLPVVASANCDVTNTGFPEDAVVALDPGGVREALARHGIQVGGAYIGEVLGNPSGGITQGTEYDGLLQLNLNADMHKLGLWKGLCFHTDVFQIHGHSISAEEVGSIVSISNIENLPSTRLFELWLEQSMFEGKLSIRFGQLAADAEFLIAESASAFIASTFGWTTISSDNLLVGGPIYPMATPGVRIAISPKDETKLMVAVYNGDPVGPCSEDFDPGQCNQHGLEFRLEDPPLLLTEADYSYNQEGNMPGTIKLGGWRHFGKFDDQRLDVNRGLQGITGLDPLSHEGNYAFYGVIDQTIYRLPGEGDARGISIFARVVGSPSDRNQIDVYVDTGIVFTGMTQRRPNDVFGVGFAYTGISDHASAFDRDSGLAVIRNYEALLEISYTAEIRPGWTLQPDFKYVWKPGGSVPNDAGTGAVGNATVLGARTTINF
jgi:porin